MVHFEPEPAEQLASDIRSAHQAIDNALSGLASLTNSVIQACCHSDPNPAHIQALVEGMAHSLTKIDDARKGVVRAQHHIKVAQRKSNPNALSFGCVGPGPIARSAGLGVVGG